MQALIAFLVVIVIYLVDRVRVEDGRRRADRASRTTSSSRSACTRSLGFQVSPASVIGLLTILGYSLYDTVVVFDKVRENTAGLLGSSRVHLQPGGQPGAQPDPGPVDQHLADRAAAGGRRSCSSAPGLLGAGELKDLALVLFVGMLSGTYSSICIATPVLADLKEREPQYKALAKRVAQRAAGGRARQAAARRAPGRHGRPDGTWPCGDLDEAGRAEAPAPEPGLAADDADASVADASRVRTPSRTPLRPRSPSAAARGPAHVP